MQDNASTEYVDNKIQELRGELMKNFSGNKSVEDLEYRLNTHRHTGADMTNRLSTIVPVTVNIIGTAAATSTNYPIFFTTDRPVTVVSAVEVHGTKGTDASGVSLQVQKLTGTTALGSGTDLLNSGFDLKGTINTTQYATVLNTGVGILSRGDRLALKTSGTLTAVADVQVTVFISYTL